MALSVFASIPSLITHTRLPIIRKSTSCNPSPLRISLMINGDNTVEQLIIRRTSNYHPPIWDYDYLQSLTSDYVGETYNRRHDTLKRDVKAMLSQARKPNFDQLELIDVLQRLGIHNHFKDEIGTILNSIYTDRNMEDQWKKQDLQATALQFRLLRQRGYSVPQDVFSRFKDERGTAMVV